MSVINLGPTANIQCRGCEAYINQYVTFSESGKEWRCNICEFVNDVSSDYLSLLDVDQYKWLDLMKGSVEIVAPTRDFIRPPMPPQYLFIIDVSLPAVRSDILEVIARTIKSCLDKLSGFPRTRIGFLTFDRTLHFYNLKWSSTQPQMMVISDLDDIFVPMPDDFLVNLSESRCVVETFLDNLPSMFLDTANSESAFGPALKAAHIVMSQFGGKLLIFQATPPSLGIGCLAFYGKDREFMLRIPRDPFYEQMAADFSKDRISVNVYAFSDKYSDIASLGCLAKYTGGQINYYPYFRGSYQREKFRCDLTRDLTRETAWESIMRIRCGKGLQVVASYGHFMELSSDLMSLPTLDCDKTIGLKLSLANTISTAQPTYLQASLFYTSSSSERRIRVFTMAIPVVAGLEEMYNFADIGAIISLFSKIEIKNTFSSTLEMARQRVQSAIIIAFKEYRDLYRTQNQLVGGVTYPEALKCLPLYVYALCKSVPLHGGNADVPLDERCAASFDMMVMPVEKLLKLLYPSLIRIDSYLGKGTGDADDFRKICKDLPLTAESLDPTGLYLYDDGFCFILWFGRKLSSDLIASIIGGDYSTYADLSEVNVSELESDASRKLQGILRLSRGSDASLCYVCRVVRQGEEPRDSKLLANLVEDQGKGLCSYVDWMQHLKLV